MTTLKKNAKKNATCQGDDYTTGCLQDYPCLKNYYKMIATDLSKQALDAAPRAMQQINFMGNVPRDGYADTFFIIEKAKETILDFFIRNSESIVNLFCFNISM